MSESISPKSHAIIIIVQPPEIMKKSVIFLLTANFRKLSSGKLWHICHINIWNHHLHTNHLVVRIRFLAIREQSTFVYRFRKQTSSSFSSPLSSQWSLKPMTMSKLLLSISNDYNVLFAFLIQFSDFTVLGVLSSPFSASACGHIYLAKNYWKLLKFTSFEAFVKYLFEYGQFAFCDLDCLFRSCFRFAEFLYLLL